jgi:glycosyltransferase involved in cell wall biosynthesis
MSEPIRISVIIPCHNGEAFLKQALDSVLAQTFPAAEIVLVDDGSTDGTPALGLGYAERYAERCPTVIRYIRQEKSGVSTARNRAVREARYEWIAFLDADDWWKPEKLARQVAVLQGQPQPDLVYTSLHYFVPDQPSYETKGCSPDEMWPALRYGNLITPSSVLLRRRLFLEAGGFDLRIHGSEDWELWVRLILQKKMRLGWVPEALTCYRETNANSSKRVDGMLEADWLSLPTMISDMHGLTAFPWRQRIRAAIFFRAAMNARQAGDPRELSFLLRSLECWPLPFSRRPRFRALLRTLLNLARKGTEKNKSSHR